MPADLSPGYPGGTTRESHATSLLHLAGQSEPVRASFRYLVNLRARLEATGRKL